MGADLMYMHEDEARHQYPVVRRELDAVRAAAHIPDDYDGTLAEWVAELYEAWVRDQER